MKRRISHYALSLGLGLLMSTAGYARDFDSSIAMVSKSTGTYYVNVEVDGLGTHEFMVDTGSGYMTLSEPHLQQLLTQNKAVYVKDLRGILANGQTLVVPVYQVTKITVGGTCTLQDVQVAVFPGTKRQILGLNVLTKVAPFAIGVAPPQLMLSNCVIEPKDPGNQQQG